MKNPFRLLREFWWARQRAIDIKLLWPTCKELTPDLATAHQVFMVHAANDPAWIGAFGEQTWTKVQELT